MYRAAQCLLSIVFVTLMLSTSGCKTPFHDGDIGESSASRNAQDPFDDTNVLFDWNTTTNENICTALKVNNNLLTIGAAFTPRKTTANRQHLDKLQYHLETEFPESVRIVSREERLSILNIELHDCELLDRIRNLEWVKFVEPKYFAPLSEEDVYETLIALEARRYSTRSETDEEEEEEPLNPGDYDPTSMPMSYTDYIRQEDGSSADIMERHGLSKIYEKYDHYGSSDIGVAIIDNGVFADREEFFQAGGGEFDARGYYRPFSTDYIEPDGPHPQPYDIYGIMQAIGSIYEHGTRQTERVYTMAPNTSFTSVRASPFVFWFLPSQFQGVTESILALAEDPNIRIISCSMGTIFQVHEIERAIDYFNAFDKIFVSAAGTSVVIVKDIVKVVFPANLPTTISTTGLANTAETDGEYVLGRDAHGGVENDFVVDHTNASSESVSTSAGMIALAWSANPDLNRQQVIDILVESSENYQRYGEKDPVFGWGKVDFYKAYSAIRDTR